ncbi:regulatory protein RecX [Solemya velesiana gill symbiont]|uniref:regulatory protein RecX n=1 Tax=Solemya velesiana gill symbiont TaxID=1918948 RepID=UPI00155F9760|nr:regulatory protein RecX [Solemya velesiana gill symbiont]
MRLLASREHTRAELKRKLGARAGDPELLDQVLNGLESQRLQSDSRFVEQYVESRKRKGYGPLRIRQELQQKGVSGDLVDEWLDERDAEWRDLLRDAEGRKYGASPVEEYKEKAKRARFLEYRGFPTDMIRDFLWSDE